MMNRGVIALVCFALLLAGVALVLGIRTSRVIDHRLVQLEATGSGIAVVAEGQRGRNDRAVMLGDSATG